mmetsp:Transcript_14763/g.25565  ORF Transcript_14763/g.25565 Transcript_14763/m.25565 type:complete len:302 (+) Transcript_14763:41-946(+)
MLTQPYAIFMATHTLLDQARSYSRCCSCSCSRMDRSGFSILVGQCAHVGSEGQFREQVSSRFAVHNLDNLGIGHAQRQGATVQRSLELPNVILTMCARNVESLGLGVHFVQFADGKRSALAHNWSQIPVTKLGRILWQRLDLPGSLSWFGHIGGIRHVATDLLQTDLLNCMIRTKRVPPESNDLDGSLLQSLNHDVLFLHIIRQNGIVQINGLDLELPAHLDHFLSEILCVPFRQHDQIRSHIHQVSTNLTCCCVMQVLGVGCSGVKINQTTVWILRAFHCLIKRLIILYAQIGLEPHEDS